MHRILFGTILFLIIAGIGCTDKSTGSDNGTGMQIIFLHHSTGGVIWDGGVSQWIAKYNTENGTDYNIQEQNFPKARPYGWKNYPYDYWNIWVNHAGDKPYVSTSKKHQGILSRFKAIVKSVKDGNVFESNGEPTLEILTKEYDLIVWKHCFPVCDILPDNGTPDVTSEEKRLENYKVQYEALKQKMHEFPNTKFLVWTGAAQVEKNTTPEESGRAREFAKWVTTDWDERGDNIFVWDFRELETDGGLYLKPDYARSVTNSHPNEVFAQKAAPLFGQRIVDVLENKGDIGSLTGMSVKSVSQLD